MAERIRILPGGVACPIPVMPTAEQRRMMMEPRETELAPGLTMGNLVMDTLIMSRPPQSQIFTVDTTPRLLLSPPHIRPYLISNPSVLASGNITSVVLATGTVVAAGNTQAGPLGVSGFSDCHFFLDVTAVTGVWDIYAQAYDPGSLKWADSQAIFTDISTTGTSYASVGTFGIVSDLAIRWVPTSAGSMTFSLTSTLKGGTGVLSGLTRTIYLGGRNVTVDTGIPIFDGKDKVIYPGYEVEIWVVASTTLNVKVFIL